jgi:hypothetical protein
MTLFYFIGAVLPLPGSGHRQVDGPSEREDGKWVLLASFAQDGQGHVADADAASGAGRPCSVMRVAMQGEGRAVTLERAFKA